VKTFLKEKRPFFYTFIILHKKLYTTGIAIYPDDGTDPDMLMKNADRAMYSVKEQGRNGCRRYDPSISNNVHRKDILTMQ